MSASDFIECPRCSEAVPTIKRHTRHGTLWICQYCDYVITSLENSEPQKPQYGSPQHANQ